MSKSKEADRADMHPLLVDRNPPSVREIVDIFRNNGRTKITAVLDSKVNRYTSEDRSGTESAREHQQFPVEAAIDYFLGVAADFFVDQNSEEAILLTDISFDRRLEEAGIRIGFEDHPSIAAGIQSELTADGANYELVPVNYNNKFFLANPEYSRRHFFAALLARNRNEGNPDLETLTGSVAVVRWPTLIEGVYLERTTSALPELQGLAIYRLGRQDPQISQVA